MAPAISNQIPIYIRNTFAPLEGGTRIFEPRAKGARIFLFWENFVALYIIRCWLSYTTVNRLYFCSKSGIMSSNDYSLESIEKMLFFNGLLQWWFYITHNHFRSLLSVWLFEFVEIYYLQCVCRWLSSMITSTLTYSTRTCFF